MNTPKTDSNSREVDCAIVGGGFAGLSAAINLGRMRRSVIVVDDRDRFRARHQLHNYLGFPGGVEAGDLRLLGHRQAEDFGAEFLLGRAAAAARDGDRFTLRVVGLPPEMSAGRDEAFARSLGRIVTSPVEIRARTLILATGVRGRFPDFPGVMECVGKSLFWCLHCDGYASIDRVVGVVGHDEEAVETAMDLLEFTPNVTIAAGRPEGFSVPRSRLADLGTHGIAAYPHGVLQYEHEAGQMRALVLDVPERMRIPVEQVYTVRTATPATDIARQLGIELNAAGYVVIDSEQNTNLPGVWAAGDSTSLHDHQVSAAVHEGGEAACAANYYLYSPEQRNPVREPD